MLWRQLFKRITVRGSEAVSWLPDESHLLAVEKSVTAHKGGFQRGIVVSLKGRRGGGGGGGGGGTSWGTFIASLLTYLRPIINVLPPIYAWEKLLSRIIRGFTLLAVPSLIPNINEPDSHAAATAIHFPSIEIKMLNATSTLRASSISFQPEWKSIDTNDFVSCEFLRIKSTLEIIFE